MDMQTRQGMADAVVDTVASTQVDGATVSGWRWFRYFCVEIVNSSVWFWKVVGDHEIIFVVDMASEE